MVIPSLQKKFTQAQRLYKQGKLLEAKNVLREIKKTLEDSAINNPLEWSKLIQAANEILALELIWASFQIAKGKTISFEETLALIEKPVQTNTQQTAQDTRARMAQLSGLGRN